MNLWGLLSEIVLPSDVKVCLVGVFHVLEFTQDVGVLVEFKDLFNSSHVTVFRTLGLPVGIISLCGLWLINVVGQQGVQLEKWGLPHPDRCLHYEEAEETIDHLLTNCVFERQFWSSLL